MDGGAVRLLAFRFLGDAFSSRLRGQFAGADDSIDRGGHQRGGRPGLCVFTAVRAVQRIDASFLFFRAFQLFYFLLITCIFNAF